MGVILQHFGSLRDKTVTNTLHGTKQIFKRQTVGTDLYSYELTWVSEYKEVSVFIYPSFN